MNNPLANEIDLSFRGRVLEHRFQGQTYAVVQAEAVGGTLDTWDSGTIAVSVSATGSTWTPYDLTMTQDGIWRIDVVGMSGLRFEVGTPSSDARRVRITVNTTDRS